MQLSEADKKYKEIIQSLSPEQRLRITFELHELGLNLVRANTRSMHPTWDEEAIEAAVRERVYGETTRSSTAHTRSA